MIKIYISSLAILLMVLISGCDKTEDEFGAEKVESIVVYGSEFFFQPSEIYWGVSSNIRSYTYNWTFDNNCTKKNPKVGFLALLFVGNNTLSNPFSFNAGISTCNGIQPNTAIMSPLSGQITYESIDKEIGMKQCFSGQSSASIYPYVTISFTSLGSSRADSLYLMANFDFIKATRVYNVPK
ncbi:MAG: hypothetical protein ABIO44_09365 [Saprospiraceae bacterium]